MKNQLGDSPFVHLWRVFSFSLPAAGRSLQRWEERAACIPCPALRREALDSLQRKRFHCQGGTVLAVAAPERWREPLVEAIVALQTISDYLDNLCDRGTAMRNRPATVLERDFRLLHRAMLDAVSSDRYALDAAAYYRLHPFTDDGGYLQSLVLAARAGFTALPGWPAVQHEAAVLARRYSELQVLKHLPPGLREARLQAWLNVERSPRARGLAWWERAAAAGSTLGIFALALEAARSAAPRHAVLAAYDPWLASFHILLDYLIDQAEDKVDGELNFVAQYPSPAQAEAGLVALWRRCEHAVSDLPDPGVHRLVLYGLVALYLSDRKAAPPAAAGPARALLAEAGWAGRALRVACRVAVRRRQARADGVTGGVTGGAAGVSAEVAGGASAGSKRETATARY